MEIHTTFDHYQANSRRPLILGVGNFDGVHRGHQALLQCVLKKAKKQKGIPAVFTFREHPQQVLHPGSNPGLLTTVLHKLILFAGAGIESCFLISFTKTFSKMTAANFVEDVLVKKFNARDVVLGFSARFGHDRAGDAALMAELAKKFDFGFEKISPVRAGEECVSSSRIRKMITEGKFSEAEECLGRPHSIVVQVIRGDGRGKGLGYPTANLDIAGLTMPPEGVYPVLLRVVKLQPNEAGGKSEGRFSLPCFGPWHIGALNYGRRPTFKTDQTTPCAEVFVLNFQEDLYGQTVEVVFYPKLRGEMAFKDVSHLKQQIAEDVRQVNRFFGSQAKNCFTSLSK
jgi:riboflavin kinase/FMN adenylyltransferase